MTNPSEIPALCDLNASCAALDTLRSWLLDLLCQLAYQEGDFVLSSGQQSSYYINCKQVTLHPAGSVAIARLILPLLPLETEAVAGLTLGADPMVSSLSVVSVYENRPIPALIIRKEAKGHGTKAYIEGPELSPGANVVVLEDVVTTGQSALKAVQRLTDAGYSVDKVIALVDRHQGGAELYQNAGLNLESLYSINQLQTRYQTLNLDH